MPKIKAFIKSETKENAKKCIPLVSIYINSENPEGDFGVFAVYIGKLIAERIFCVWKLEKSKYIFKDMPGNGIMSGERGLQI